MLYGHPGLTGNFSNPAAALTYSNAIEGASGMTAMIRVVGLLGIFGLLGWGIYRDRRNPLLYVGLLAVILGLSLNYIYLPIRAGQHPRSTRANPPASSRRR